MAGLDTTTILNLTTTLARNLATQYAARFEVPWVDPALEQQFGPPLAPGLVAFIARLSAALPPDYDLAPVLRRFCADPAVAAALLAERAGPETTQALAGAFLAAGMEPDRLDRAVFDEALAAFSAAAGEMSRRLAAAYPSPNQSLQLYEVQRPAHDALRRTMSELLDALATSGLARVDAGQVIAADGYTVLFAWAGGTTAEPQMAESAPPDDFPAEMAEEFSAGSGGLEAIDEGVGALPPSPPPAVPESPPPPSPAPQPPAPPVVALRLDAAAPPQVVAGRPFDLAVAIRRPESDALAPADLTQRESADFAVTWPQGVAYLAMRIQVSAPGCDIHGGDSRQVRLLPGADGPPVYFQLTPRQAGPLSLIITVYQESDWIGSARLLTEVGGESGGATAAAAAMATTAAAGQPRGGLTLTVTSAPLGNAEVNQMTLRRALDDGYSDPELRDLCFELEIDYDDLPGDGQSAKARELVLFAKRRGLLAALVERVMRDRPHLLIS